MTEDTMMEAGYLGTVAPERHAPALKPQTLDESTLPEVPPLVERLRASGYLAIDAPPESEAAKALRLDAGAELRRLVAARLDDVIRYDIQARCATLKCGSAELLVVRPGHKWRVTKVGQGVLIPVIDYAEPGYLVQLIDGLYLRANL